MDAIDALMVRQNHQKCKCYLPPKKDENYPHCRPSGGGKRKRSRCDFLPSCTRLLAHPCVAIGSALHSYWLNRPCDHCSWSSWQMKHMEAATFSMHNCTIAHAKETRFSLIPTPSGCSGHVTHTYKTSSRQNI